MPAKKNKIPQSWKETTLGEVTEWFSGGTPLKSNIELWNGDTPWISAKSLIGTRISDSDIKITNQGLQSGSRLAEKNDILLLVRGSGLYNDIPVAIVTKPVAFNQDIKAIRTKAEINPWYLLYWFIANKNNLMGILESTAIGAGKFDIDVLKTLTFLIPPKEERTEITKIARCFDDKTEILKQQNKTLEKIAQTIFKEWFVDFTVNGKKLRIDNSTGLPEGWRKGRLGEIVEVFDSKRIPLSGEERAKRKGKYPYYGATKIIDYIDDYIFDGIYVLLAEDGSVMDGRGYPVLQYVWGQIWVNNHAHVLQGKNGWSTESLNLLLKRMPVSGIITGAVQLKINQGNLLNVETVLPDKAVLAKFDLSIQPIFSKIRNNNSQIKTLSRLRDALLPKLMKGEIRVKS